MFERQKSGSVLCPGCGSLVGVNDESCYTCGRRRPGLFGFAALLRNTGEDMGFLWLVLWVCGALFLATLAASEEPFKIRGLLGVLSPDGSVLARFGAAGWLPVFQLDRWWTVLSYAWLHGSAIHIAFNMMAVRDLVPAVAHLYGPARTIIIYTLAAIGGGLLSSAVGAYLPFLPWPLSGARLTVGASGAVFGLVGSLAYYGRRGGSRMIGEHAWGWVASGALFGLMMPGIDNWCHAGGFVTGYFAARWLDPLHPERGDHVILAVVCLVASAASILASLLIDIPGLR